MGAVPMSTPNHPPATPTLQTVQTHLLEIDPTLRARTRQPVALPESLMALEKLNITLKDANAKLLTQSRALYKDMTQVGLSTEAGKKRLADLDKNLQALVETDIIERQGRRTFMAVTAGSVALEHEARLNVSDHLLAATDQRMLEDCSLGPAFRPGMYALTFTYQDQTVEFAGAFVLTRQSSPVVDNLTTAHDVGPVLLFTPSRGLEAFPSLQELDQRLLEAFALPAGHAEFIRHLPVRYQALDVTGIWPLALRPIEGAPLFEYTWDAILEKRRQDIKLALDQPLDAPKLIDALDKALTDALPDLTLRLGLRAQRLLEWHLHESLPNWFRSAEDTQRSALMQQITVYNRARQAFINALGPAATPQSLAHFQLVEQLAEDLDIHDLNPDQLLVTTRRTVPHVGTYTQSHSLVELSLRGLHTGDELPGSAFMKHTVITYAGAALSTAHAALSPPNLLTLLKDLQPRLDFAHVQKTTQAKPEIRLAARTLQDQRLVTLALIANLQGQLNAADFRLFEQLRELPETRLRAHTVSLHGAQLKDLWVLREESAAGEVKRLLLCTPESPRAQSFIAFNSERECQTHMLAWADDSTRTDNRSMSDYIMEQVALRFRPKMALFLRSLSFRPDADEHLEVTFSPSYSYSECLDAMVTHLLDSRLVDDYQHGTPSSYRAASAADRMRLTTFSNDAVGALQTYNARHDSEAYFDDFKTFLHKQAKLSLNKLLGQDKNDVDPDSVFAHAPTPLPGQPPKPLSYTELYRDGYEDGIGFINEKFSASATFRGPPDVDLTPLTAQKVARSVTGVWIGQRYADEVRKRLLPVDSQGYAARREAILKVTQLQMKSAALESRLQGHIASQDLAWLERAIDSMPDTSVASRNTYHVHRLSIEGDWVNGCYLFRHANEPVMLYTPNAPDTVGFREARLFNYLVKKDNGFLAYFTERVPVQSKVRISQFLQDAKKALPDDINPTTPSPARHDPLVRAMPLTDLRHDLYNMRLQRKIDDVHATTVNRTQMITGILWTCVEWVTAIATIPFPALSLSLGGLLAFKEAMLGIDAYYQGDNSGALMHYIGYLANLVGALLFDLRPAFTGPFNIMTPVRPVIRTGNQAVEAEHLKQLLPDPPKTMQPVLYEGQTLWTPQTPDALGRHLLYRNDPVSGQMLSTGRLVNQGADGQWIRSGVAGGGRDSYQKLVDETDNALAIYETPADQSKNFRALLDPDFNTRITQDWNAVAAHASQSNAHQSLQPVRTHYARQVDRLTQDANAFFQMPPALPVRGELPELAAQTAHAELLKNLLGQNKGLVVGAVNTSIASKQLLIENIKTLAELGVKRLYIENLPADLFRKKLAIINRQAKGNIASALKSIEDHLARVDLAMGYTREAPYTFRTLMLQAHQHNIAVEGLDATCSYHMNHLLDLRDGERFMPRSSRLRNFYSHKVIERNTAKNADEGWIALVEQNRLGTYETVPGLPDLQNTLALRVVDAAPGQSLGVAADTSAPGLSRGHYTTTLLTSHHARVKPGTPQPPMPAVSVAHYSEFDMPPPLQAQTRLLAGSHRGLDTRYSMGDINDPGYPAFQAFSTMRQDLLDRASATFRNYTPPARPSLARIATTTGEEEFIEQVYQYKLGLIIGEAHAAQSSKNFLIKHMKRLKELGVKTLYVEHLLTDLLQHELNTFHDTLIMPSYLKAYLKQQDNGHMPMYTGPDNYSNVVKAANKYGIRVRALDCTASYHVKGAKGTSPRNTMFSYFANEVIKADQAAYGPHKWVAFMGSGHVDMHELVPGIAQLQDAVSLLVRDMPADSARTLRVGGWIVDEYSWTAFRSDFLLEMGIAGRPAIRPPAPSSRSRLKDIGHFQIERPSLHETHLVHKSNSGEIVVTPIQIDDKGQFFIDRWEALRGQRFLYQTLLIEALKRTIHLVPAP